MFEILLLIILFFIFIILLVVARYMWLELKRKHVVGKRNDVRKTTLGNYIHKAGR